MNKHTIHVGDFCTVASHEVRSRKLTTSQRVTPCAHCNSTQGYSIKIPHMEKLGSTLVHLPVSSFGCSAFSTMSGAGVTAFYKVHRRQHSSFHRMIILPNSTCNCGTMLGLHFRARLASSRRNPKEKWRGILRQKSTGAEAILFT